MTRGFTLIELVVVMTIIAILAGVLVPLTYKAIESGEETATLQKLLLLKKAMVGDPQLIQGGVRTDFGFVGDMGVLPTTVNDLTTNAAASFPNWKGPYLAENEPGASLKDSWGREFIFLNRTFADNKPAEIRSAGPDGQPDTADDHLPGPDGAMGTADDIYLYRVIIDRNEAAPAGSLQANVSFSPPLANEYRVKLMLEYNGPAGKVTTPLECMPANGSSLHSLNGIRLPVGRLYVTPQVFSSATDCAAQDNAVPGYSGTTLYVLERMETIPLNAQFVKP